MTAIDLHDGQTMIVNGHIVHIEYVAHLGMGLVSIIGHEGATTRAFKLADDAEVTLL